MIPGGPSLRIGCEGLWLRPGTGVVLTWGRPNLGEAFGSRGCG